jgi:hypothetical protein
MERIYRDALAQGAARRVRRRTRRTVVVRSVMAVTLIGVAVVGIRRESSRRAELTQPSATVSTPLTRVGALDALASTNAANARRSQPYWAPLTSFTGTGNATTTSFTVDSRALQWRISWHCEAAPFAVVSVNAAGQQSQRKLADAASCPRDGEGFSADKGGQMLMIRSSGPWTVAVEQQIDTPLVEPAPAALSAAKVVGTGNLYNVDRAGEGTLKIYEMGNGTRLIRLENFFVTISSDLEIGLSELAAPRSSDEVAQAPFKVVSALKATVGNMNYDVPKDIDVTKYKSIVIWSETSRSAYAAASIQT